MKILQWKLNAKKFFTFMVNTQSNEISKSLFAFIEKLVIHPKSETDIPCGPKTQ